MDKIIQEQLSDIGIKNIKDIVYNPSYETLYQLENSPELDGLERVQNTQFGAVNVMTGIYTGRSPKDKYILKDNTTENNLWWTSELSKNDNKPIVTEVTMLDVFYEADKEHQNYYNNNSNQGYCSFVIAPKLAKLRKLHSNKLK